MVKDHEAKCTGKHRPFLCTSQEALCILPEASRLYEALQRFWRTIQGSPGKNSKRQGKKTLIFDKNVLFSRSLPSPVPFPGRETKKRAPSSDGTRFLSSASVVHAAQVRCARCFFRPSSGIPCRCRRLPHFALSSAAGPFSRLRQFRQREAPEGQGSPACPSAMKRSEKKGASPFSKEEPPYSFFSPERCYSASPRSFNCSLT